MDFQLYNLNSKRSDFFIIGSFQQKCHRDRFCAGTAFLFASRDKLSQITGWITNRIIPYPSVFYGQNEKTERRSMKIIKMDDLNKSFHKLVLDKTGNNKEKQLVDSVNLLMNEEGFEKKFGFKLMDHIEECGQFVDFLREKVVHIRNCNRGTGK